MWVNISKFGAVITVVVVEIHKDIYLWVCLFVCFYRYVLYTVITFSFTNPDG